MNHGLKVSLVKNRIVITECGHEVAGWDINRHKGTINNGRRYVTPEGWYRGLERFYGLRIIYPPSSHPMFFHLIRTNTSQVLGFEYCQIGEIPGTRVDTKVDIGEECRPLSKPEAVVGKGSDINIDVWISKSENLLEVWKQIIYDRGGKSEKLRIKIPPMSAGRGKIKYKGKGIIGNPPGDLLVTVKTL